MSLKHFVCQSCIFEYPLISLLAKLLNHLRDSVGIPVLPFQVQPDKPVVHLNISGVFEHRHSEIIEHLGWKLEVLLVK